MFILTPFHVKLSENGIEVQKQTSKCHFYPTLTREGESSVKI
nr:MAG TPA: hypothetical protein [Microviridae sp.]